MQTYMYNIAKGIQLVVTVLRVHRVHVHVCVLSGTLVESATVAFAGETSFLQKIHSVDTIIYTMLLVYNIIV